MFAGIFLLITVVLVVNRYRDEIKLRRPKEHVLQPTGFPTTPRKISKPSGQTSASTNTETNLPPLAADVDAEAQISADASSATNASGGGTGANRAGGTFSGQVPPPVTPLAPPPSEMGRTDAPVVPPGQNRGFSGP